MFKLRASVFIAAALCFSLLGANFQTVMAQQNNNVSFERLKQGETVSGFRADAVYLNDSDAPMGARFVHARTGFTIDLLEIQSVPQVYMWVKSYPTSDMGEPHTQEHLLLGKGNKGRSVASLEEMSLAGSNASTYQWYTTYHFHTAAGSQVFYNLLEREIDALLHPDYTDEEIRREVRNFGVIEDPADKTLRLEEKGSVYNEMVSSMSQGVWRLYDRMGRIVYGENHPLAFNSGGAPAAIREMQPEHIKKFHRENYRLGNMGMIASLPKEMTLGEALAKFDTMLNRLEPQPAKRDFMNAEKLPAPAGAAPGKIELVEYPFKNAEQPGTILFAYPAKLEIAPQEELLLGYFLNIFAGDATTNLYKKFIDTKTREMDLGAQGVFSFLGEDQGHPVYIGLEDVAAANLNESKIGEIRQKITAEIRRVAEFKDNSPELAEFNARLRSRLLENRRQLSKFVNSPPGFGFRNTGNNWLAQILFLNKTKDFRKSVTLKNDLAEIEKLIDGNKNFWRDYLAKWNLTETTPYAAAARANPKLIEKEGSERKMRAEAEVARLKAKYNVGDAQEAIRRYQAEYDKNTAELEKLEKAAGSATKFVENPPLTLDDQLDYKVTDLQPGGVKMVASTFDNMTSATTGIAFNLKVVPENELVYVSVLPELLRNVGVVENGKPVSFEDMSERIRKEILSLNLSFATNIRTGRVELVARGAGNNAEESARAIEWLTLLLQNPDWRKENLPRIRDVVDQELSELRNRTQNGEEYWVNDPANAYRRQNDPVWLATSSFMTQAHNAHRLRWLLKEAGSEQQKAEIKAFLTNLADAQGSREELKALLAAVQDEKANAGKVSANLKNYAASFAALSAESKKLAVEIAKDLDQLLADVPDSSLAADWNYLVKEIQADLLTPPEKALGDLNDVRRRILKTGNARLFQIASRASQQKLDANVKKLLASLENAPAAKANYSNARLIDERLKARTKSPESPVFVGLAAPNMAGGVFLHSAPSATYMDTDREKLLEFLASRLYGGGGAHSIFMKTWGAGLAYSNGLRSAPSSGFLYYYAERTPELPQTLQFVIGELKRSPRDPNLAEYAVAQALGEFRSASPYETRGEAMAADLADGLTPAQVTKFRQAILELRKMPDLAERLYDRMGNVYARVLPGYGVKASEVKDGVFFVIGPEKQLNAYENYLKTVEGGEARLNRLYPRDFWMIRK